MDLNKKHIDFIEALANFFFKKIAIDENFKHDRLREWNNSMPTPSRPDDSNDLRNKLITLHDYLVRLENINTSDGDIWLQHQLNVFLEGCADIEKILDTGDVNPVNRNILFYHRGVHARASGNYSYARECFYNSNAVIDNFLSENEFNIGLYRDRLLNRGHISTCYALEKNHKAAILECEELMSEVKGSDNLAAIHEFDKNSGICSLESWGYYYFCKACLSGEELSDVHTRLKETVFSQTFTNRHHHNWNVPTLFQVLRDPNWKEKYPDYIEEIANLLYQATGQTGFEGVSRKISVLAGRRKIQTTQAAAASVVGTMIGIYWFISSGSVAPVDDPASLVSMIEAAIAEFREWSNEFLDLEKADIDVVQSEILKEIGSHNTADAGRLFDLFGQVTEVDNSDFAIASNGNERTILGPMSIVA